MSTFKQRTVDSLITSRDKGSASSATLQEMFPASPIHNGELTRTSVEAIGNDLILGGEGADGVVDDRGYWGFSDPFNRNYINSPDTSTVATGGGGLPGTPWTPAPGSPGPGSMSATDIPAPPADWPGQAGTEYGSGEGGLVSPSTTSERISKKTLGSYGLGTSS